MSSNLHTLVATYLGWPIKARNQYPDYISKWRNKQFTFHPLPKTVTGRQECNKGDYDPTTPEEAWETGYAIPSVKCRVLGGGHYIDTHNREGEACSHQTSDLSKVLGYNVNAARSQCSSRMKINRNDPELMMMNRWCCKFWPDAGNGYVMQRGRSVCEDSLAQPYVSDGLRGGENSIAYAWSSAQDAYWPCFPEANSRISRLVRTEASKCNAGDCDPPLGITQPSAGGP